MKKYLVLLLATAFAIPVFSRVTTVLVYMAADNNLWQNAVQDINDMESAPQSAGLSIIVQTDMPADSPYPGGQRRRIVQDNSPEITSPLLADLGEIDSGDPQTLKDFINWGFDHYEGPNGQRNVLVIWGHGDNWFKGNDAKWICPDNGSESIISVAEGELKEALTGIPHLDILIFDACSMQSVEVLAEVMHAADYVIGSEELVPASGFPYQTIIPIIGLGYEDEEIAALIPQKYLESYEPGGIQNPQGFVNPLTCSAIRTSALPDFYEQFSYIICLGGVDNAPAIVDSIRSELWEMNTGYCDVDVEEFMSRCMAMYPQHEVSYWINLTLGRWNACVVYAGSANIPHEQVGSAAIWFPWHRQYFDAWWESYSQLEFASSRWLGWLNRGLGDEVAPEYPQVSEPSLLLGDLVFQVFVPPDPDALSIEVRVSEDDHPEPATYWFYPEYAVGEITAIIPVSSAGAVTVRCRDASGNWSEPAELSYSYNEPALELVMAPNPVRDRSLASARWYLSEAGTGEIGLELFNLRGQRVLNRSFNQAEAGQGVWLLSAEEGFQRLGRGLYMLKLRAGGKTLTRKLTIL